MALFSRYALTDNGKALIAKSHIKNTGISFTRAATGSGIWEDGENLEVATKLKNEKQTFPFSSIQVIAGNDSTVILTVDITNEKLNELYILNEMGILQQIRIKEKSYMRFLLQILIPLQSLQIIQLAFQTLLKR